MLPLRTCSAAVASAWLLAVPSAKAEGLRFHGDSAAARAVGGFQASEFGWGGSLRAGVEWAFMPELGVLGSFNAMYLGDGAPPPNARLVDYEIGSAVGAGVGLHARPLATNAPALQNFASGLWLQGTTGMTRTGGGSCMNVDLSVGWDLLMDEGSMALGPSLGWLHVFQPDQQLRPEDANVLTLGLHGMFDTAARTRSPKAKVAASLEPVRVLDADGNRVADALNGCPTEREDHDGVKGHGGCPEYDQDQDGISDAADRGPKDVEDLDAFEGEEGCPDDDNDNDDVLDAKDLCPNESPPIAPADSSPKPRAESGAAAAAAAAAAAGKSTHDAAAPRAAPLAFALLGLTLPKLRAQAP